MTLATDAAYLHFKPETVDLGREAARRCRKVLKQLSALTENEREAFLMALLTWGEITGHMAGLAAIASPHRPDLRTMDPLDVALEMIALMKAAQAQADTKAHALLNTTGRGA